jgi:hypothetical protein
MNNIKNTIHKYEYRVRHLYEPLPNGDTRKRKKRLHNKLLKRLAREFIMPPEYDSFICDILRRADNDMIRAMQI